MKRFASATAIAGLVLTGAVVTAPSAAADDRYCRSGTIGKVTIDGDLKVPSGTCYLKGTRVKGNVIVSSTGYVGIEGTRIDGNVQSYKHRGVAVRSSYVDGNIQLKSGGGLVVRNTTVNGDIQLFSNPRGNKYVYDNRVDGNLQCKSNIPAPKGARNKVKGNKEGQCRRF